MAYSVQAIKYGWAALIGVAITGATIYVVSNTRRHAKPVDIIEIALGVTERCLATQYATNPLYRVNPPSFVRTWESNVYTATGVTTYSETVTNTIGWYIDRVMMTDLDSTIKALVPYYGWSNNPGQTMTFTGLLAHLNIGDGTNFTRTPAIGTNAATYGDYPQQVYVTDLQERYKVLEACRYFVDENKDTTDRTKMTIAVWTYPLTRYAYSNTVTGVYPEYGWRRSDHAWLAGLPEDYYYNTSTNHVFYAEGASTFKRHPTWDEAKAKVTMHWYYFLNGGYSASTPPYWNSTSYYEAVATDTFVGEASIARRSWQEHYYGNVYDGFLIELMRSYGTVRWANYQQTNISSTFSVYYKAASNYFLMPQVTETETATNEVWYYPREYIYDRTWSFEETVTMSENYQRLDDSFLSQTGIYNQVVFGSDEFPQLALANSFPPWCDEPSAGASWINNEGSVGRYRGIQLYFDDIIGVREFQFSYCTNKFW